MPSVKFITIFAIAFALLSCETTKKSQAPEVSTELEGVGLFKGFNLLNVPRTNINLGSEWVTGTGPRNQGFKSTDLVETQSLSNYDFQSDNKFNAKLKLSILKTLGLNAEYQNDKTFELNIDSAAIVRVADLDQLNYQTGTAFVWEGIKVKSISLSATKGAADTISLTLNKISKNAEIAPSQGLASKKKYKIDGLNLYTAFKLVSFGEAKITDIPDWFAVPANTPVEIHADGTYKWLDRDRLAEIRLGDQLNPLYEIKFSSKEIFRNSFTRPELFQQNIKDESKWVAGYNDDCKLVMSITCNNEIIAKAPKKFYYNLWCSQSGNQNGEDITAILSSRTQQSNYVIEQLVLKNLKYDTNKPGSLPLFGNGFKPQISHKKISIEIKDYVDNSAKGW